VSRPVLYFDGVFGVPTIAVENVLFWGPNRLGEAAAALAVR
jgi:2-hydroxychromene-2-carboxylate isomerase